MADLRIGTCSWKYDSWKGLIYPEEEKINYLKEYSKFYKTVEVDQWFWSLGKRNVKLPYPKDVKAYKLSIPDDFKFTVKMPNSLTLTHHYRKDKNEELTANPHFLSSELLDQFLFSLSDIKENLGPLMFQFEYLNKQKMLSQLEFQANLANFFDSIDVNQDFAVEIRNPNYLNKSFFEFLNEYGLSYVFLEGYYMPSVLKVYDQFKEYINKTAVIRLHGPDRKGIEKLSGGNWDKIIQPKDKDLQGIVEIVKDLLSKEVDVYLNVNNHYEGSAPLTINKITKMI